MDLSFRQNQSFALVLDIQAWQSVYPLSNSLFHMQVRTAPNTVPIIYSWSSNLAEKWGRGVISFTPEIGLLSITAPYSDMINLTPGTYEWDLTIQYLDFHKVLTGGAFFLIGGITV